MEIYYIVKSIIVYMIRSNYLSNSFKLFGRIIELLVYVPKLIGLVCQYDTFDNYLLNILNLYLNLVFAQT